MVPKVSISSLLTMRPEISTLEGLGFPFPVSAYEQPVS